ncbi:hypothetical protein OCU04_006182 [Sclerotinia nivalis]|uniref:Uncharacterized protein n=1 Tax=Sclerotinia nivalis TaxID=352851 RepID=A0A9X0AMH4_9HELO|nr:hypothetical protein OCU04_006182 [Sclerotinia nivalis]
MVCITSPTSHPIHSKEDKKAIKHSNRHSRITLTLTLTPPSTHLNNHNYKSIRKTIPKPDKTFLKSQDKSSKTSHINLPERPHLTLKVFLSKYSSSPLLTPQTSISNSTNSNSNLAIQPQRSLYLSISPSLHFALTLLL